MYDRLIINDDNVVEKELNKKIEYIAKLYELKDNLRELKNLNMKVDDFDDRIIEIEKKVEENYKKNFNGSNLSNDSSLYTIYSEAINSIDDLNNYLIRTYKELYQIQAQIIELNSRIKDVYNYSSYLDIIISDTIVLLSNLKNIKLSNSDIIDDITEEVYEIVYKVMKLELLLTKEDFQSHLLYESIKSDKINSIYISRIIKKEIEQITNNNKKNSDIDTKLGELIEKINKNGFEGKNYIDKDLIYLLASTDNSLLLGDYKKELIDSKIDLCYQIMDDIQTNSNEVNSINDELNELKHKYKTLKHNIGVGNRVFAIFIGATIGITGLIGVHLRKEATTTEYNTTTLEYDSNTGDTTEKDASYLSGADNNVLLSKYSSWQYDDENNIYTRTVSKYKINTDDYDTEDFTTYLKVDPTDIVYLSNEVESVNILFDDSSYLDEYYTITRTTKDLEDYQIKIDNAEWIFMTILAFFVILFINMGILVQIPDKYCEKDGDKELLESYKKKIERLKEQENKLLDIINELDSKLSSTKDTLQKNLAFAPPIIKNNKEIEEKVLMLVKNDKPNQ